MADALFELPPATTGDLLFGQTSASQLPTNPADLLFELPPAANGNLLFGQTLTQLEQHVDGTLVDTFPTLGFAAQASNSAATLNATLPALTQNVLVASEVRATLTDTLPALTLNALAGETVDVALTDTFTELTFAALVAPSILATLADTFPALSLAADLDYQSRTQRPTTAQTASDWQRAGKTQTGVDQPQASAVPTPAGCQTRWQPGTRAAATTQSHTPGNLVRTPVNLTSRFTSADRAGAGHRASHQDADRQHRPTLSTQFSGADPLRTSRNARHQDAIRDRRASRTSPFTGTNPVKRGYDWHNAVAKPLNKPYTSGEQDAMKPPAGTSVLFVIPPTPENTCYPRNGHLLFKTLADGLPNVTFICDNANPTDPENPVGQIVIPVLRTYIVINEASLVRVSDGAPIIANQMAVSFDCDSWVPQFSATIPESARNLVLPGTTPVEVAATINGTEFRFIVERINRSRQFGQTSVSISGRGIASELDAPYALLSQHTNTGDRTAQQLIDDALQFTGYTQSWNITDWLIPANEFSHHGTPISVALQIAEASGSVLSAGWATRNLNMRPRYPVKPWDWATATPDYIIPADVAQTESLEWIEKPAYNAVFVSGQKAGVLAQIKRLGSAGDIIAPMVTHPLITHADAARQRGTTLLSDTGRKAMMQISLPVLPASGIIDTCKLIEFTDGANTRRGLVRANNIAVQWPTVRQNLTIEAVA